MRRERELVREPLWLRAAKVEAEFQHRADDLRVNALCRVGPSRRRQRTGRVCQRVEEGGRHLRATRAVHAGEDHLHGQRGLFDLIEPAPEATGSGGPEELRGDERRDVGVANSGERVRRGARHRHRGIRERRRAREPVSGGDVGADCEGRACGRASATGDDGEQTERRDDFGEQLGRAASRVLGGEERRQREHDVRGGHADERARNLRDDVYRYVAPGERSVPGRDERHCRVQVGTRDRCKREDQGDQRGTRRDRVREQCESGVPAGEALAHYA